MSDSSASLTPQLGEKKPPRNLPIFSIIDSIDLENHFVLLGDVGTGKTTVTPIHEFQKKGRVREIVIREPSRASCNALYYSLEALYPEVKSELAVITKDTKINVDGRIKIVTDGVLLRMLAENSLRNVSIYFDESHQMTSQLELCMSLAKRNLQSRVGEGNLFRIMSATIDPGEFLAFMQIKNLYTISGRRFPVSIELEMAEDTRDMLDKLSYFFNTQPYDESWIVFLPTRRLVEKYARSYGGTYLHGGLEGAEVNKIQQRAELDKNLRIFATNVIASSVNIYVDNVLIFNEKIDGRDKLGHKVLEYKSIDNNSLLQMIGRIGRFKPGRAVILSDVPIAKTVLPAKVSKALEQETPFDLVLLMSKYGLKLTELEFMSKLNLKEIEFAQDWLFQIGAIERETHRITEKGLWMTEIPYDPDFAHMISEALQRGDEQIARFLLAAGAFGDSLNHAYRSEMEVVACEFLYELDKTSELGVKAKLLEKYSNDTEGAFVSKLVDNGVFVRFLDEAWKNYEAARDSLNDVLKRAGKKTLPREIVSEVSSAKLAGYLKDCLTFERFYLHEAPQFAIVDNLEIEGDFYARSLTMNYRKILYDIVALGND